MLTFPFPWRRRLAQDGALLGRLTRIFVDTVQAFYARRAAVQEAQDAKTGAVTVVQRTSSDLRLNPHLHAVFLDGAFHRLLPLAFFQFAIFHAIAVAGILLTIAGYPNIYAVPEYSVGGGSQWIHALAHLTIGMVVPPLLGWGVASLVMLATRKLSPRPATA